MVCRLQSASPAWRVTSPWRPVRPTAALAIQVTRGILSMGWASRSVDHVSNPTLGVHPLARSRCQGLVLEIVNLNATSSGQFGTIPRSASRTDGAGPHGGRLHHGTDPPSAQDPSPPGDAQGLQRLIPQAVGNSRIFSGRCAESRALSLCRNVLLRFFITGYSLGRRFRTRGSNRPGRDGLTTSLGIASP